ncbi:shikimate 5-dehydrogenase [Bacteroidia bacterium]|nr:shikimate 5-dehydrogenase [Bacteroidia bacterium]
MNRYGIIGYPLTTCFSKPFFTEKFERERLSDSVYELFPLEDIEQFPDLCRQYPDLVGLNVTIPYKKAVIPYLTALSDSAQRVGAVNVIKFLPDGSMIGYNTDIDGFEQSFKPLLSSIHQKALILGTGGAALAVAYSLTKLDIAYRFVSRTSSPTTLTYQELKIHGWHGANILINTTPLGMKPRELEAPDIPYEQIAADFICYDLIYEPSETIFLQRSKSHGATIMNGLQMLHIQAIEAWKLWQEV